MTKTYDGLSIDLYIHRLKSEAEKWGRLASEPVPREHVLAIIEHFETVAKEQDNEDATVIADLTDRLQEANNDVTLANRRVAAANARETKCKNELKALKDEQTPRTNEGD